MVNLIVAQSCRDSNWSKIQIKMLILALIVIYLGSIFVLYDRRDPYTRPSVFYISASIILTSLAILSLNLNCNLDTGTKLVTFLFLLLVIFTFVISQYYLFPLVTGVDPWFHMKFNNDIVRTGRIPYSQSQYFGMYASSKVQYSRMPVFHILIVVMRYIESIDYKSAVMFSISLPQLLIVSMITYLLSRYIFKRSSGLNFLVVLITISAEHFIFMLRNPIPNSLGGVYLALVFWSLFKFLNEDISPKVYLLLLIFSFTLSITHSISTIAMFIALGSVFMLLMIHESILKSSRDASKKTFMLIILSGVVVYFWWTYISGHTPKILDILKTGLIATKLIRGYAVMKTKIHFFDLVIGVIPVIIYHILALIGIAILLFRRGIKEIVSDKILALTILIGGSYAVLGSIPRLLGFALLAHRWWYFSEMFLSVPVAIGVSNILIHKSKLIKLMGVITVAIYFTLTLTEPQYVSIDGMSYYEKDSFRYSLILSELQYTNFAKVHNITCVSSDEYYAYVLSILGMKTEEINDELLTRSFETVKCPVIGIRTYMLFHPIKVHQFVYKVPYNPLRILSPRVEWNKIYSSNALNVFRKIYI